MSKSAISLLSMISPGSVNFDAIPGGSAPAISPADVCAALSTRFGLSKGGQLLGFYLLDEQPNEDELIAHIASQLVVEVEIAQLLSPAGQQGQVSEVALGLAKSALFEVVKLERCTKCDGNGKVFDVGVVDLINVEPQSRKPVRIRRLIDCPGCRGHGVKQWSMNRRARVAGINDRTYTRRYHSIRELGYRAVRSWLNELLHHLQEQLR